MNKTLMLKIAAAVCVIALLVCAVLIFGSNFRLGTSYADAEQYTAGGTTLTGPVENLDIHWTEGSVTIAYHAKNTVEIVETASRDIPGNGRLRWWLDGTTLRIQYARPGYFSLRSLNKALTVTLPEGIELNDAAIETASADVKAPALRAKSLAVNTTSGDVELAQAGEAETVALSSTSGDLRASLEGAKAVSADASSGAIELTQANAAETVALSSTSGDVRASLKGAASLSASTTSGRIAVEAGDVKQAKLGSTSGDISVRLAAFERLDIDATSGEVAAALPSEPGFRAEIATTSGDFTSGIALKRDGDLYACGDESAEVRVHTTSGDVRLEKSEEDK